MGVVYFLIGIAILFLWVSFLLSVIRKVFGGVSRMLGIKPRQGGQATGGAPNLAWLVLTKLIPLLGAVDIVAELMKRRRSDTGDNARGFGNAGYQENNNDQQAQASGMDKDEARRILGVDPNATKQDIQEAYKRLMMRNHPDGGGTDYLAMKINQARDALLKR